MFHENLKAQRQLKGLTQETLAIKVNVVRQTVSKWEKGLSVPDADTLQRIAEVLDISVSQLLGGDPPEDPKSRNEMAEQLAQINEQLAIQNRRARRVWKGVLAALIVVVIIPILGLISFSILGAIRYQGNQVAGMTEWSCVLDGTEYCYSVEYDSNYQILTAGGDAYIANHADTERYDDANQLAAHLADYFEEKGGTVTVTAAEGLTLLES